MGRYEVKRAEPEPKATYMRRVVENRYAWLRQMDNITTNLAAAKEFVFAERLKLQV